MRFSIRTPRGDARYAEAVAKERRKLRAKANEPNQTHDFQTGDVSEPSDYVLSAAPFNSALMTYLAEELGLLAFMDGDGLDYPAEQLPMGSFSWTFAIRGADPLITECAHAGLGVVTFTHGSRRGRFKPGDILADERSALEFIEGPREGDPRWDSLHALARERQSGLTEDEWRGGIAATLGVSVAVSPEEQAVIDHFEAEISAAGFDEARLRAVGESLNTLEREGTLNPVSSWNLHQRISERL